MNELDVLKETRTLLSDPAKWHKGSFAIDAGGRRLSPQEGKRALARDASSDHVPVCFCTYGALRWSSDHPFRTHSAVNLLLKALRNRGVPGNWQEGLYKFNDDPETKHEDVLALLDEAIKLAEEVQA